MSFWCPQSSKKRMETSLIVVKLNSFIHFLEETSAWNNHFVWPLAFMRWTNCSANHLSLFWEAMFIFWKLFFSFVEVNEKFFHSFPSVRSQCQLATAAWPTLPTYCWLALQYPYYIPSIYLYYELGLVCSVIIAHLLKDPGH